MVQQRHDERYEVAPMLQAGAQDAGHDRMRERLHRAVVVAAGLAYHHHQAQFAFSLVTGRLDCRDVQEGEQARALLAKTWPGGRCRAEYRLVGHPAIE